MHHKVFLFTDYKLKSATAPLLDASTCNVVWRSRPFDINLEPDLLIKYRLPYQDCTIIYGRLVYRSMR